MLTSAAAVAATLCAQALGVQSDVVFDAVAWRTDVDRNGVIDFNEWLLWRTRHDGGADGGAAGGASHAVVPAGPPFSGRGGALGSAAASRGGGGSSSLLGRFSIDDDDDEEDEDDEGSDDGDGLEDGGGGGGGRVAAPPRRPLPAAARPEASEAASAHGHVSKEYMELLVGQSASRAVVDELHDLSRPDVAEAAAAFLEIEAGDRGEAGEGHGLQLLAGERAGVLSGLLTLEQFETSLVSHTLASGTDSGGKAAAMFAKADLNGDGRVDFNEFLALRRRALHHAHRHGHHSAAATSPPQKLLRHKGGGDEEQPSPPQQPQQPQQQPQQPQQQKTHDHHHHKHGGKHGGKHKPKGHHHHHHRPHDVAAAEDGTWVLAAKQVLDAEEGRVQAAHAAEQSRLAKRFAIDDGLEGLSADDLLLLETELLAGSTLPHGGLDAEACRATLHALALRVGKILDPREVDALVGDLERQQPAGRIHAAALLVALRERAGLRA